MANALVFDEKLDSCQSRKRIDKYRPVLKTLARAQAKAAPSSFVQRLSHYPERLAKCPPCSLPVIELS